MSVGVSGNVSDCKILYMMDILANYLTRVLLFLRQLFLNGLFLKKKCSKTAQDLNGLERFIKKNAQKPRKI